MKKYFLFAMAIVALVGCTDESFVGDESVRDVNGSGAIVFNTGVNTVTRAEITGSTAAGLLNNNFVFAGTKGLPTGETPAIASYVFDQYTAHWVSNTAHTTESNSNDWEYVNYTPATTSGLYDSGSGVQSIKYWDYSATQYDFAAYSLGTGVTSGGSTTYATATAIDKTTKSYSLTGTVDQLKACYISDLVTAYNQSGVSDYGQPVQFKFRSLAAKIRLAFYETVPGYSVKDVKFYTSSTATLATDGTESDPTLFTSSAVLPAGSGTMTVTFPTTGFAKRPGGSAPDTDYNKAHISFAATNNAADLSSTLVFEDLANLAAADYKETAGNTYLGRASNAATYAGGLESGAGKYYTILPYETGANLQLRIQYTLVSRDGSGEEITVNNATAVIPAELAQWNPNYAYTYIFKIGDMTNGSTGVDGSGNVVTGLTPITLDAVVVDSEDGVQETITTVSTPSITTYMAGKVITSNDEYITGKPIYVIVNSGTSNVELTVGTNANLFTATVESGAAQGITEETVANCFANGTDGSDASSNATKTVTDANGKKLVLTAASGLTASTQIDAADSPTGNVIIVNGAKFNPSVAGNYVFQYVIQKPVAAGTYDATTAAAYNATLPGAISTSDEAYSFTSYGSDTGSPEYGTGKVKVVSTEGGWTTVLVTANSVDGFVGSTYKVNSTTFDAGTYYQLYSTDGTPLTIYVKIATYNFTDGDVSTYNATLTGAVSIGDQKPAVPGKYQYKVIKVQ